MIGEKVMIQLGVAEDVECIVKSYDEDSGFMTAEDEDGHIYKGYEYQAILVW